MALLFPLAFLGALAVSVLVRRRTGRWRGGGGGPLLLVLTLAGCYAAAFVALNLEPYYEDDGWPEFMELRYRWVWAAVFGGGLALVVAPAVFALRAAGRALCRRREPRPQRPADRLR